MGRRALLSLALAIGPVVGPAAGRDLSADLFAAGASWSRLDVPGQSAAEFHFLETGHLRVSAQAAVGFLYRRVGDACPTCRFASWRWRVQTQIAPSDQAVRGADDRAIAVHLWFDNGDRDLTLFGGRAEQLGYPRVTHFMTYVWGGVRTRGSVLASPHHERGRIFVLRDPRFGPGRWQTERIDILSDLNRAFGGAVSPGDLKYVAVSGDTDDTRASSVAEVADLRLLAHFGTGTAGE